MNRKEFQCRFVKAGRVRAVGDITADIEIVPGALAHAWADGLFESRAVFVDHAGAFEYPSLRNLVGVTFAAQYHELDGAVDGIVRLYDTPEAQAFGELVNQWLSDRQAGEAVPDVGLSLVFFPLWEAAQPQGEGVRRITGIRHVESVDFVFEPATEARVIQALSSCPVRGCTEPPIPDVYQRQPFFVSGRGGRPSALTYDGWVFARPNDHIGAGRVSAQPNSRNYDQNRKENNIMRELC